MDEQNQAIMVWMGDGEKKEIEHVDKIRDAIVAHRGVLPPKFNIEALGFITHYYSRMMERLGKYEAMQREQFADLMLNDPDLTIGKAEAIAKGSDFGKRRVFYEKVTAGYLELINTLKKVNDYWQNEAKNQM